MNQYVPGLCELETLVHWSFVWTTFPSGKDKTYYPPHEMRELYEQGFIANLTYCDKVAKKIPRFWTADIVAKIRETNGNDKLVRKFIKDAETQKIV